MQYIFISYSSQDRQFAERVADKLKASGLPVWWDANLTPGDEWDPTLDNSIRDSFAMVVLVTSHAVASHWVTYEWTTASTLGIRVIPLLIEKIDITSIHKKLERFQILSAIDLDTVALDRLVATLKSMPYPLDAARNAPNRDVLKEAEQDLLRVAQINEGLVLTLLKGLDDSSKYVREASAYVLGELRREEALPQLLNLLVQDKDAVVRAEAAEALGKIRDKSAVPNLLKALYDTFFMVRRYAAEALGLIGTSDAVDELIELLTDESAQVRGAAADALGLIADNKAVQPLIALLSDIQPAYGEESVCTRAAKALVRIGTIEALHAAREWRQKQPNNPLYRGF